MNDVLPKPFTKEGLLSMLEKHLGHLKKPAPGMEQMAPPPSLAQVAAKNSLKSEDSPVTSPATVSNWASPGGNLGASPSGSNAEEYMHAVQAAHAPPVQYAIAPGMQHGGLASAIGFGGSPPRLIGGGVLQLPPGLQQPPHRRHISEISGGPGDMGGDIKRQQIGFPPPPPGPMTPTGMPPHLGPQGMGQPLQSPLNPMHRRPG